MITQWLRWPFFVGFEVLWCPCVFITQRCPPTRYIRSSNKTRDSLHQQTSQLQSSQLWYNIIVVCIGTQRGLKEKKSKVAFKKIITCKNEQLGIWRKKNSWKREKIIYQRSRDFHWVQFLGVTGQQGHALCPPFPAPHLRKKQRKLEESPSLRVIHKSPLPLEAREFFNLAFPEPSKEQSTKTGANGWVFPSFRDIHLLGSRKIVLSHSFHACPNSFFLHFCYTNVKCRNERQRPFGSAKHPQNKQETNYQLSLTKKQQKHHGARDSLLPEIRSSETGCRRQTLQEIHLLHFDKKNLHKAAGETRLRNENLSASRYFQLWQHKKMLQNQFIALRKGTY